MTRLCACPIDLQNILCLSSIGVCEKLQAEGEPAGLLVSEDLDGGMRPKLNRSWAKLTLYL